VRQEALRQARELEALKQAEESARQEAAALQQQAEQRAAAELAEQQAREGAAAEARATAARKAEEEAAALAREQEAQRQAGEAEERRLAAESEARKQALEGEARKAAEDAGRRQALDDQARRQAEEGARQQALALEKRKGVEQRAAELEAARQRDRAAARVRVAPFDDICRQKAAGWYKSDIQVELYAAVWRDTIKMKAPFDLLQAAKAGPYENPLVTVGIRSDGSVDSVTFNKSSGRTEIDEAVRRIIDMLAPYRPFPRELEADCNVVEFPSIWSFDRAVRLNWRGR
jgi:TolA protein